MRLILLIKYVFKKYTLVFVSFFILSMNQSWAGSCQTLNHQISRVSFGTYVVDSNLPVGGVIATISAPATPAYGVTCEGNINFGLSMLYSSIKSSYSGNVYKTDLDGVGIRMYNTSNSPSGNTFDAPQRVITNVAAATQSWGGGQFNS